MKPEEQLQSLYKDRNRLYLKGGNDEKLNDKIRKLQKETDYKVVDVLGTEKSVSLNG
jgi:hypothetical protein